MQPCGKDRGNSATGTRQSAVGGKAALASVGFFVRQLLEQIRRRTSVNFVWGVTVKSVMRHLAIVGLNEKVDEGSKSFDGIKRVQVKPVVFERSPKGLDHGVGLCDVNLCEHAAKAGLKECGVDGSVDVFNAGICHDGGCGSAGAKVLAGFDQNRAGGQRIKPRADGPGQNLAGVVVDDSVDVSFGAVDELDDGDIDVPQLIGLGGSIGDSSCICTCVMRVTIGAKYFKRPITSLTTSFAPPDAPEPRRPSMS